MANIKKDEKTGTYYFKISMGTDPSTGKRRQTTRRGFQKKSDAIKAYNDLKNQYYDGQVNQLSKISVETFYKDYLAIAKNRLKDSSYDARERAMRNSIIKKFGSVALDKIRPLEVQRWMQEELQEGYAPSTINQHLSFFKDLMNKAVEMEILSTNRIAKVRSLKIDYEEMEIWTSEELGLFLDTFNLDDVKERMYYTLFKLLFYSGMRINEALALTKDDVVDMHVDINKIIYMKTKSDWKVTTPKSKHSVRSVTLDEDTLSTLIAWKEQAPYDLIFSLNGEPLSRQTVRYFLRKHANSANVKPIRVHDLRHSHASFLINLNINIIAIAKRLGHKDATQVIETYGHLYPSYQFDIAENINNFKTGSKCGQKQIKTP